MKRFQRTVLSTALILLIIILTAFAILLRTSKAELIYPPMLTVCPDQYTIDGSKCKLTTSSYPNNCKSSEQLLNWKPAVGESMEDKPEICCPNEFFISDYKSLSHSKKKINLKKNVHQVRGMD